jgi:hypothetical protein
MFDIESCKIPTVYCGTKTTLPPRQKNEDFYYTRIGTPHECMSKGFGAGINTSETKGISPNSLRKIKYVGEVYVQHFEDEGINNINSLIKYANNNPKGSLEKLLKRVFVKKDGVLDKRAYNSTLMYLFRNSGQKALPVCQKITL